MCILKFRGRDEAVAAAVDKSMSRGGEETKPVWLCCVESPEIQVMVGLSNISQT